LNQATSENSPFHNVCPRCGAALLGNALFCGQCGSSISHVAQSSSPGAPQDGEQKSPWQWIAPAIGLWVVLLAINGALGLFGHLFDISSPYFDLGAQGLSAFFILVLCFEAGKQLKPLLRRFGCRGIWSYIEIIGALIFIFVFMWLYFKLASFFGISELTYLDDFKNHNWPVWSTFIVVCLLPGIFEELAFRGYIMMRLEKVGSEKEALILQAAMFSILHMLPAVFISHFVIGLILGMVRLKCRSLYPGMLIHTLWNAIVIFEEAYRTGAIALP